MAIKLKIPKRKNVAKGGKGKLTRDPVLRVALIAFLLISAGIVAFFSYFYVKYDRIIEKRFIRNDSAGFQAAGG